MLDSKNIELKIKDGAKLNFPINIYFEHFIRWRRKRSAIFKLVDKIGGIDYAWFKKYWTKNKRWC